ncbi:MAG: 30S ribosomal protein S16 [Eubacteriaceae bacterium]|nr:30S ribosomal protein S16 [Eubacteriaceae bacterium]MBQ1465254.1 30S ribosomal protein S16 [Eubacteriaceae bacterium]MCR4894885.1 30S ribosomal protein S16 [Eubacteriales bacterium]
MAVKIRLKRMGAKKKPYYRIVVADDNTKRDGIAIEELGSYNPLGEKEVHIDAEAAKKWLSNGAQPTETVKALFKKNGIM